MLLRNWELRDFYYYSIGRVPVIKSRLLLWAGHAALMME